MNTRETRALWKRCDDARDAEKKIPEGLTLIKDLSYGRFCKWNKFDIYCPKDAENKVIPTIISVHGGGYFYGTKETYFYYCLDLARRGYRVVSFNYRLAPENKYPCPIIDFNNLIKFLLENKERYHIDFENLFVVGDSAGAHLASQLALIYSNPEYRKTLLEIDFAPIKFKGIGLNCGFYEWDTLTHKDSMFIRYIGEKNYEKYKDSVDTLKYIDARFPPTMICSCNGDFLLPHAKPFYDLLIERGVKAELKLYMPEDETLFHVHHVDVGKRYADIWNSDQMAFFGSLVG
ncbi:MAG: alpha/beta hydrolase [Bacilli bacterium]|nr:alpha/beta hydrolase [Bacilli bacterium]